MIKTIILFIVFAAALYGLILILAYFIQVKMMFLPGTGKFGDCPEMQARGAEAVTYEDIHYYILKRVNPDNWIIFFHGNAGNACDRTYFFDIFSDFNSNLLVFEYPGYGRDGKTPGQTLFLEKALKLVQHIGDINSSALPIYLMGESIGTGVATFVATETRVSGLILISAYTSLARVAQYHYPWLPAKTLMKNPFPASEWASHCNTPALLIHGKEDDIIPLRFGKEQLAAFVGEKQMLEISGSGHNDIMDTGQRLIQEKVRLFISQ